MEQVFFAELMEYILGGLASIFCLKAAVEQSSFFGFIAIILVIAFVVCFRWHAKKRA